MAQTGSEMGLFSKLPPEIRSQIWDNLRPSGRFRHKTDLAILRANKVLCAEIVGYLHSYWKRLKVNILSKYYRICYPGFYLFECGNNKPSPQWDVLSLEDAIDRGFQHLPLHLLTLEVEIRSPDPHDPGQLVCLWERLQGFIRFLQHFKRPIKHLVIHLHDDEPDKSSSWPHGRTKRFLNFSIPNPSVGLCRPRMISSDIDVVLLPFLLLQNAPSIEIRAADEILQSQCPLKKDFTYGQWFEDITRLALSEPDLSFRTESQTIFDIIDYYIQCQLDSFPGKTAGMIRLDRFAHWDVRNYEKKLLLATERYPVELEFIDRNIFTASVTRHCLARLQQLVLFGKVIALSDNQSQVAEKWFLRYPDGLPPFNHESCRLGNFWYKYEGMIDVMLREMLYDNMDAQYEKILTLLWKNEMKRQKLVPSDPVLMKRIMDRYYVRV